MRTLLLLLFPISITTQLLPNLIPWAVKVALDEVNELASSLYEAKNISQSCYLSIQEAFSADQDKRNKSEYYINKLIRDSSHTKSDVTTFNSCMKYKYEYNQGTMSPDSKPAYLITSLDFSEENQILTTEYKSNWHMFGLCAPKGCNVTEYKHIIYSVQILLEKPFNIHPTQNITLYALDNYVTNYDWSILDIARMIPLMIIVIQLMFICFGWFPFFLVEPCFASRRESINGPSQLLKVKGVRFNKKKFYAFKDIFSVSNNAEQLFFYHNYSKINNDSGLNYLKGIQGIGMIFMLFGTSFFVLYNNPAAIYSPIHFIEFSRNFLYGIFFFGLRYAPRILFSCSGFSLFYKMMCYLDEKVEDQIEKRKKEEVNEMTLSDDCRGKKKDNQDQSKEQGKEKEQQQEQEQDPLEVLLEEDDDNEGKRERGDVKVSFLLQFYAYQIPKYILLFIIAFFCLYSLYPLILIIKSIDPMWYYFNETVLNVTATYLIKAFTMVTPFFFAKEEKDKLFNFFWPVYNEMFFFIFTPMIIFLGYKFKAKIDYFVYFLMINILILKGLIFLFKAKALYRSTLFFYFDYYGQMFVNPFCNYIYYLIGVLFGMINYNAQKDITIYEADRKEFPFLDKAAKQLNFFKKRTIDFFFAFGFLTFVIIIMFSILTPIILNCYSKEYLIENKLEDFLKNEYLNWFMLIDCEIVVFLIHFIVIAFYIKGNNNVIDFFSAQAWSVLSRSYYSFLVVMSPVMLYVFYQSETRINFDLPNNTIFAFICGVLVFIFAILCYICFELPYKKFIKILFEKTKADDYVNFIPGNKIPTTGKVVTNDE